MQLLTNLTSLDSGDECVAYGGLVDRDTACAGDVALWCDAEIVASVERAAAAERSDRARGWHAA